MTRQEILDKVRANIDEVNTLEHLDEVGDVFGVADALLNDSANEMLRRAPLWLCQAREVPAPGHRTMADGSGSVMIPDDFLKLHTFKMSDWKQTVHKVTMQESDLGRLQENKFLRGTPSRPVVVHRVESDADPILVYYSSLVEPRVVTKYLYVARIDDTNTVEDLTDRQVEGLVLQATVNFFIATQRPDVAQAQLARLEAFFNTNN